MNQIIPGILAFLCVLGLVGCSKTYDSTDALMEKVRQEIPLAEADTVEIRYAGMTAEDDAALLWYISGSEYQAHTYFPIECEIIGESEYKFVRSFAIVMEDRCGDVGILQWRRGYSFCINNPDCKTVRLTDDTGAHVEMIEIDSYPYVFYTRGLPSEYVFLDADGNELS